MSSIQNVDSAPDYIMKFIHMNMEQLCKIYDEGMYNNSQLDKGIMVFQCSEKENKMDVQFMNDEIKRYVGASGTSQLDIEGNSNNGLPIGFAMYPNFPNPFNPITQIRYDLPKDNLVNITIYDIQGRKIRTLINIYQVAGYHSIHWNATAYSSGIYFVKMVSGKYINTQKLMLIK